MSFPFRRVLLILSLFFTTCCVLAFLWMPGVQRNLMLVLEQVGVFGFFVFSVLYNVFLVPFPYDVFLLATPYLYAGSFSFLLLLSVLALLVAACLDYILGACLTVRAQKWFSSHKRYPQAMQALHRFGGWAVLLTAVTPLPFSLVCWVCGMARTPWGWFLLAVLLGRGLRTTVVLYFIWI